MCACVWVGVLIDLHLLNVVHYATSGSDPPESDPPGSDPPGSDPPGSDPPGSDPPESDPRHMAMCLCSITDHSGRPWQTMWLTVNS